MIGQDLLPLTSDWVLQDEWELTWLSVVGGEREEEHVQSTEGGLT